jgi:hypothetical protein
MRARQARAFAKDYPPFRAVTSLQSALPFRLRASLLKLAAQNDKDAHAWQTVSG